jgi:hypothetical protein
VTRDDCPDTANRHGVAPEVRRTLDRLGSLPPGHRRAMADPDHPGRPDLGILAGSRSLRRAVERVERGPVVVTDCDELTRADVDTILRGGGRHVPTSFPDYPTSGFVVFVGRTEPAIVFIDPVRYPLRVPLSSRYAHLLVNRLRAAVGKDAAIYAAQPPSSGSGCRT